MPINYNCQIYHRVRLKQIRFKFKVVKHYINQMKPFCHFAKPWRWDGDETICEMNQKEKGSQPSSIILSHPFWNKKSHYTAGCSNFVAWIRSRKILKWNSPKGAWSITSFSFLQHIFYNSVSKNSLAGIFHANDFPLTGSSLVQRLRCPCRARVFLPRSSPTNQCHWVHSELPGAAEILKTGSFALILPLCQCHQICQPVQDILEWKNCFPSTDRKDLLPLKGGQRVAICSNTLLLTLSL